MTDDFFDTIDTAVANEQAKADRNASSSLGKAQKYIDYGTKVLLLTPSIAREHLVVGRICPPDEYDDLRRLEAAGLAKAPNQPMGTDAEEAAKHAEGYRRGLFFSTNLYLGFTASYHLSRLYPLTEDEFDNIREAKCDPAETGGQLWYKELEDHIITAVENLGNTPYRKRCEKCGSGRVVLAETYVGRKLAPMALEPTHQGLTIRTGDFISDEELSTTKFTYLCADCKWESDAIDEAKYPNIHACTAHASPLEALYRLAEHVI